MHEQDIRRALDLPGNLDSAPAIHSADYLMESLPYVVGINCFDGRLMHRPEDIREAMSIDPAIPMVSCDARDRESVKQTLIALVEHAMRYRMAAGAV